jgi:hypothetical protein
MSRVPHGACGRNGENERHSPLYASKKCYTNYKKVTMKMRDRMNCTRLVLGHHQTRTMEILSTTFVLLRFHFVVNGNKRTN